MQTYILILLSILVVLLIGVIYFGWRKIINLEIENSRNKYDIEALRNLLSRILEGDDPVLEAPIKQFDGGFVPQNVMMNNAFDLSQMQYGGPILEKNVRKRQINLDSESEVETLESSEEGLPRNDETSVSVEGLEESSYEETEEDETEEDSMEESEGEDETEEDSVEESEEETVLEEETVAAEEDEAEKLIENELGVAEELPKEEVDEKPLAEENLKDESVKEEELLKEEEVLRDDESVKEGPPDVLDDEIKRLENQIKIDRKVEGVGKRGRKSKK